MLTNLRNVGLWMLAFVLIGSFTLQADENTTWQDIFNKLQNNTPQTVENMGVNEVMVPITSFPYTEDFENGGSIPTDWTQDPDNDGDWEFGTSAAYGPDQDHTTGSGYFAWIDDSTPTDTIQNLLSPVFDISSLTNPYLTFYAWIGDGMQENASRIFIDVYDSTNQTWHTDLDSVQENGFWELFAIDLSSIPGDLVQIRFRGYEDSGFDEDIGLDDVSIVDLAIPGPATVVNPPDGVDGVIADPTLMWNAPTGVIDGYLIYFGTDGGGTTPPTNIENGTDLGFVHSYDASSLTFGTTYYWQIVPYNSLGNASGAPIWSFTPNPVTPDFTDDFESGTYPFYGTVFNGGYSTLAVTSGVGNGGGYGMEMYSDDSGYDTPSDLADAWSMAQPDSANADWTTSFTITLDLTGTTSPILSFDYSMLYEFNDNYANFWVYIEDGTEAITYLLATQTNGDDIPYTQEVHDLSAYAGSTVDLVFFHNGKYIENEALVDNISIIENQTLDWYNLQWPDVATIDASQTVTVYAQGYKAGITDSSGAAYGVDCWIGWSETDTDPATWTNWVPATFNSDVGNNDEYMADLGPLPVGTYYYAARWQFMGGTYTYGGYSGGGGGPWDGTTNVSGVLTVTEFVGAIPFTEDFDSWTTEPSYWSNPTGTDTIGWDINSGTTTSSGTGPEGDHTSGTGNYLYTEASGAGSPDKWAVLTSPKLYNDGSLTNPYFSLWYHMLGLDMGDLHLDIWDGTTNGWTNDVVMISGDQGNVWNRILVDLSTYGDTLQFRISGKTGAGYESDMAIDDFEIIDLAADDYGVAAVMQVDGVPDPFKISTRDNRSDVVTLPNKPGEYPSGGGNGAYIKGGKLNPSGYEVFNNGTPFETEGTMVDVNTPIELAAYIQNVGVNSNSYDLHWWVNGVSGPAANGLTGPAFNTTDSVGLSGTLMLTPGTLTSTVHVALSGDSNADNDTGFFYHTLVYPENTIRTKYDNGANVEDTYIGFNDGVTQLTAGVRFTATDTFQLAHVDAIYRSEGVGDSVLVEVWSAGTDTSAPGSVLYSKLFTGMQNYFSVAGDYITLPLGDMAPVFMPGDDYWISLTFDADVNFPMGAHNTGFTPGRSYLSGDAGATWSELVVTSERAWVLRSVGVPYMPPTTTVYENSSAEGTLPTWFGSNTERGLAYGYTSDGVTEAMNDRVYVVSRNGGSNIQIVDDMGADVGTLDVTGVSGGTFPVNDVGVSEDGMIFVCNLTVNATSSALKVYMWTDETNPPSTVVNWTSTDAVRLGDKFTVTGSTADNSAILWFASATAGIGKVYKFEMTAGTFNSTPTEVTLSDGAAGGSASVGPLPDGSFYWNAGGASAKKYQSDGTLIGTIPGGVLSTGSNAIRYLGTMAGVTDAMSEYVVSFQYGAGNENARIMEIPAGDPTLATTYSVTPTLGSNSNVGGTGDVDFQLNSDQTATIYVLSTNNGFGAYTTTAPVPVELTSFAADVKESTVTLNWATASELNSDRYIVERRAEGENWVTAGTVGASGTTTEAKQYSYTDNNVVSGTYDYRLKIVDLDGSFEYSATIEVVVGMPTTYDISQNYPNPFNPSTKIKFSLPFESKVTINVYNAIGQKVTTLVDEVRSAGYHELQWDASRYASGMYIYAITATSVDGQQDFQGVKKMMLLK